jgi:hypothetical protein
LIAAPRILDPHQALASGLIHAIELPVIQAEQVCTFIHS